MEKLRQREVKAVAQVKQQEHYSEGLFNVNSGLHSWPWPCLIPPRFSAGPGRPPGGEGWGPSPGDVAGGPDSNTDRGDGLSAQRGSVAVKTPTLASPQGIPLPWSTASPAEWRLLRDSEEQRLLTRPREEEVDAPHKPVRSEPTAPGGGSRENNRK